MRRAIPTCSPMAVYSWAGTDVAGDHVTGVQADPQRKGDVVSALDFSAPGLWRWSASKRGDGRHGRRGLRARWRSDTATMPSPVNLSTSRHSVGCSAVEPRKSSPMISRSRSASRRRRVHRPHHIGEEDGHLLVLGVSVRGDDGRSAGVTESGAVPQPGAARIARDRHRLIVPPRQKPGLSNGRVDDR